jgi:starvation-inducible outer membrane lipoprotein
VVHILIETLGIFLSQGATYYSLLEVEEHYKSNTDYNPWLYKPQLWIVFIFNEIKNERLSNPIWHEITEQAQRVGHFPR